MVFKVNPAFLESTFIVELIGIASAMYALFPHVFQLGSPSLPHYKKGRIPYELFA